MLFRSQGKLEYACKLTGYKKEDFLDGAVCSEEAVFGAKGIHHFHEYVKNRMKEGRDCQDLAEKLLMENPKQVISKSVLLDRISLDTPDCTERSLKQHISNLRKKMQDVSGVDYIETVWGIGFKLAEQKILTKS